MEEDRDPEPPGRLADPSQPRFVGREALQPRVELDAAHPVLADAALDLGARSGVARVDGRERDQPLRSGGATQAASESFAAGARTEQALVGEDDRDVDAELVHGRDVLLRPVRRTGRLVDVEVDHAGTGLPIPAARRDPLGELLARKRLRRAQAPGGLPARQASTKRSSWSAKQTSVLSPGGSTISFVPSASSTVSPNVGGSSVASPFGPVTTNWLLGSTGVSQTTSSRATVPSA